MQINTIGWDIGGAHLKAACINSDGQIISVYQEPCPLWKGLDKLESALAVILEQVPEQAAQSVLTMTGELVDLFADRAEGVIDIITVTQQVLAQQTLWIYAGRLGFIQASDVLPRHIDAIASANWLASATYVAQYIKQGLFVDIGSTTSDIILLQNKQPDVLGYTDFQRLGSDELVYTGIVRTAVMAVVQSVQFAGSDVGVMSEYFATMADIYRLTHELHEQHDQADTADGHGKTEQASARRLARMIGCDASDFSNQHWQQLAYAIREQQLCRIQQACEKQLLRSERRGKNLIIGAGIGRFLVQEIAHRLGVEYKDLDTLFNTPVQSSQMQVADCAPAVAVAYLSIEDACIDNVC